MLTFKPERRQGDGLNDEASDAASIAFDPANDRTRQEDAKDLDLNRMLTRFGALGRTSPPVYGEIDYDVDLQQAIGAIAQAKRKHAELPEDLRGKYPTWEKLMAAINSGTFETPEAEADRKRLEREKARANRRAEIEEILATKRDPGASPKEDAPEDT